MSEKLNLIYKGLSIAVLLLVPSFTAFAGDRNKNEEAIEQAHRYAERLCGVVKKEGISTTGTLSGEGKAEADNILKKFVDIGINLNGTIQREEFYNVLQEDLASVINSNTDCKKEIFKTLIDKLLPDSASLDDELISSSDVEEPSENIKEEDSENQTPQTTNASPKKLDVSSVEVNNENEYNSSHTALNIIDGNNQSYWCTKSGSIFDVVLDFHFDEPKSISQIQIYSSRDGSNYTQPVEIELIFFNDLGNKIMSQTVMPRDSTDKPNEYKLERVDNVSSVKMKLGEPKDNTANYLTFDEIRFYGYE